MIHPIGATKNGVEVFVDLVNSQAASAIARQPQLLNLAKEVLAQQRLTAPEVTAEYNIGRPIGYDFVVETPDDKNVFYAHIMRDTIVTRFIKGVKPDATNHITVMLRRTPQGAYELHTVRMGRMAPPRPGSPDESDKSRDFWLTHAVIQEGQMLQPKTVTKECPY